MMHLSEAWNLVFAWPWESRTVKNPFSSWIREVPAPTEGQDWARVEGVGKRTKDEREIRNRRVNFVFIYRLSVGMDVTSGSF